MDDKEIKLECLRLAVQFGSARTVTDPVDLAMRYMAFVKSEDKPTKAPRRKPVSKAE